MNRKGKIYTNQIRIIAARNLLSSIKILIRALQLFCVLPVYLNLVNDCDLNRRNVKLFKLLQFIRAVILIFACVSPIFYQWQYYDTNLRFLTRILFFTEYIYTSINIVLIFMKCHSYRAEISRIYNHLVNTDLKLNGCGLKVNHDSVKKRIQLLYTIIMLGLFLILMMEFIYNNNNLVEAFSNCIVFLTTECIQNSALILYSIILYIVQLKLEVMNDHIEYMIQIHNESLNSPFLITEISSRGIHPQHYWHDIFQLLRVEYFGLLNLAKMLTDIYGYVLMSTIICTSIDLTIDSYTFYIQFDEDYNNEDEMFNPYLISTAVLWTLLSFSKLFIILVPCNSMQNQKYRTIHILNGFNINNEEDETIYEMIHNSLLHLLQEKAQLSACGVMQLDYDLIISLIGSIISFLIILIQFEESMIINRINHKNKHVPISVHV